MHAQPRLTRRALLSGSVASLTLPWVLRGARGAPALRTGDQPWKKLAEKMPGRVLGPNDPRFVALTRPENLRYFNPPLTPDGPPDPDAPLVVARPRNAKEVGDAILWAREEGYKMAPRSGGHSYAGCSTVPGLVVNAGAMRHVAYHPNSRLLEVEGGALNGDIFTALRDRNRAIVHGRCQAVGVSAFLMGGGIGLAMRESGVGCDQVQSVELVLADGEKVRASSNQNPELFWAVRGGGGGNLGFATRWWLHTLPADDVIAFSASWSAGGSKLDIFKRLARALEASPEQMGAQMSIFATALNSSAPNKISLTGQYRGPLGKFQAILGSALADAERIAIEELPYWEAQEFFDIEASPNRYQETSLFADELSDALIEEAFRRSRTLPDDTVAKARLTFFLTGGHVNKVKSDATAFVHRSSQWLINPVVDEWPRGANVDDDLKWQREVLNKFSGMLGSSGSYQNFPDPALEDHAKAYWGTNLARLSRVKAAVDPDSVFTPPRNQGIPQPG